MRERHSSPFKWLMIADINKFYKPKLDTHGCLHRVFNMEGQDLGVLINPELLIASAERVAIDAVGVGILRLYGTTPEVMKGRILTRALKQAPRWGGSSRSMRLPLTPHRDG